MRLVILRIGKFSRRDPYRRASSKRDGEELIGDFIAALHGMHLRLLTPVQLTRNTQ
jgi:hypothetical protein